VLTRGSRQLPIRLAAAYLLATPAALKKVGRRVLGPRNRLRVSRLPKTRALPGLLRRVPVELLRTRRTDSQLALEFHQAAMSGPVAHGAIPETCGATPTWSAVEFTFGPPLLRPASRPAGCARLSARCLSHLL
jgi:hypothetical protein